MTLALQHSSFMLSPESRENVGPIGNSPTRPRGVSRSRLCDVDLQCVQSSASHDPDYAFRRSRQDKGSACDNTWLSSDGGSTRTC
jgi:hypothetical protein